MRGPFVGGPFRRMVRARSDLLSEAGPLSTIGPGASAERRVELDLGGEGGKGVGETSSFLHEDPPHPIGI